MDYPELNPFVRYMDRRVCRYSYKTPVLAYEYRLFYLCGGECAVEISGGRHTLCAGDCLIFPGGVPYRFFFQEDAPASQYVVNFDLTCAQASLCERPPDPADRFDRARLLAPDWASPFDRALLLPGAQVLEEPLERLLREHEGEEACRAELCSALLKAILMHALRLSQGSRPPLREPVRGLLDYLGAHYCEHITAQSLARQFNYHPYYLGRRFREVTGMGIHQYVLSLRLKKCARLLISSTLSVSEIARICGFSSASALSEYFRRVYRQSPVEYRERGRMA